jgi:hypothetical protein
MQNKKGHCLWCKRHFAFLHDEPVHKMTIFETATRERDSKMIDRRLQTRPHAFCCYKMFA